jgi:hypothetical protein
MGFYALYVDKDVVCVRVWAGVLRKVVMDWTAGVQTQLMAL